MFFEKGPSKENEQIKHEYYSYYAYTYKYKHTKALTHIHSPKYLKVYKHIQYIWLRWGNYESQVNEIVKSEL